MSTTETVPDDWDLYVIINCELREKATVDQITKCYRKQALVIHPDRNPNDPDAETKFDQLMRAYKYLREDESREAYNLKLRARLESKRMREEVDASTKTLRDNLGQREEEAKQQRQAKKQKSDRELAASETADYIETLRRQGVFSQQQQQSQQSSSTTNADSFITEPYLYQICVSWRAEHTPIVSESHIRGLFSQYGSISNVRFEDGKRMAVITYKDKMSAAKAVVEGDIDVFNVTMMQKPRQPSQKELNHSEANQIDANSTKMNNNSNINNSNSNDSIPDWLLPVSFFDSSDDNSLSNTRDNINMTDDSQMALLVKNAISGPNNMELDAYLQDTLSKVTQ